MASTAASSLSVPPTSSSFTRRGSTIMKTSAKTNSGSNSKLNNSAATSEIETQPRTADQLDPTINQLATNIVSNVNEEMEIIPWPAPALLSRGLSRLEVSPHDLRSVYKKLSLPNASVESIQFLKNFQFIEVLELPDTSVLAELKYLVDLDLAGNLLNDALAFEPPLNLQRVDLSRNNITSIGSYIGKHRFLKYICLDFNRISEISGLSELKYLTHLSLRGNQIENISNLEHLPLKYLDLSCNTLTQLDNLETLIELETLLLDNNHISSLRGISDHPLLTKLNLAENSISQLEQYTFLQHLRQLRHLILSGNSVQKRPFYRAIFLFRLPQLLTLDGVPVTSEEKVTSINRYDPPEFVSRSLEHVELLKNRLRQYAKIKPIDYSEDMPLRPIVLAGPAGAGKRTLTSRLLKDYPHIVSSCVSHTTRAPRDGEIDGSSYHFVTKEAMDEEMRKGRFVEVVSFFGNLYGTSLNAIKKIAEDGKLCIMDVEVEGVLALKKSRVNPRVIFIQPPSLEVLGRRLAGRNGKSSAIDNSYILKWLQKAPETMKLATDPLLFDATIVNDDLDKAYEELKAIVLSYWYEDTNRVVVDLHSRKSWV